MPRMWRLLTIIGLLAGLVPVLPVGTVVANDAVVSVCDEASFEAALATVQSTGGGTITFSCSGTITFTSQYTITSTVTINGGGAITFDGRDATRLFLVNVGATLDLNAVTLQNGSSADDDGGAILNDGRLTVTSSTFSGNSADNGGAILSRGRLTVTSSTFSGNSAGNVGGAIFNDGGVTTFIVTLTVTSSTFSGNSANAGGAIFNIGTSTVTSSTFSGNSADNGGAINNYRTLTVTGSTFSGNSAGNAGGAIFTFNATLNLGSSILANSPSGGNCDTLFGSIASQGSNLSDDASCNLIAASDQTNTDPQLSPLADNGGPTQTQLPQPGSPAIDAADCGISSATDQRGISRPQGPACDIGSVEVIPPLSVATPTVDPSPSNEGQSVTASASFTAGTGPFSCTVDYGDNAGPQAGTVNGTTCTGPAHTYVDDNPSGTSSDDYTVTIEVTDDDTGVASNSIGHTVNNVAPVINHITTNGPVPQGQSATITVDASDVGVNDALTYSFDCDNDGSYETAGVGNQATCTLDPAAATSTIGVHVVDDDLGVATDSVQIDQTLTLCLDFMTGAVSEAGVGGCGTGTFPLTVPGPVSTTFCIHSYDRGLRWLPGGSCSTGERPHLVPADGPLYYCAHTWTGGLRVIYGTEQCTLFERAGVIPG